MTTIHIDAGAPESGWQRVTFTMQDGVFSEADLHAVNARTESVACFDDRDPAKILLMHKGNQHPFVALAALRCLKSRYGRATFTVNSKSLKQTFGNKVKRI